MTRVKSLKYEVEKLGKGYPHRTHRSKKGRHYNSYQNRKKKKVEKLRVEEKISAIKTVII